MSAVVRDATRSEPLTDPLLSGRRSETSRGDEATPMVRLKASTRELHEALHSAGDLSLLLRESLDPVAYVSILQRFDVFLAEAEAEILEPADGWLSEAGFHRRSRRSDLAADLAELERLGVKSAPAAAPAAAEWSARCSLGGALGGSRTPGTVLGVLYVTEGSRLGGQGLARRVAVALPMELSGANRFFGSAGVDVAAHWAQVNAVINTLGRTAGVTEEACAAAQTTFRALSGLFGDRP